MAKAFTFTELEGQLTELLPARTVLSTVTPSIDLDGGDADAKTGDVSVKQDFSKADVDVKGDFSVKAESGDAEATGGDAVWGDSKNISFKK